MDDDIEEFDDDSEHMREHQLLVGKLIGNCTGMESALEELHETLLRTPLYRIVSGEGFEAARQGCHRAARYLGGETEVRVMAVLTDAKKVWDLRGGLVHGHASPELDENGDPTGIIEVTRARRSGGTKAAWTADVLRKLDELAYSTWVAIEVLYLDLPRPEPVAEGSG